MASEGKKAQYDSKKRFQRNEENYLDAILRECDACKFLRCSLADSAKSLGRNCMWRRYRVVVKTGSVAACDAAIHDWVQLLMARPDQ